MSAKRQATTELNHENWDQDDPDEHEEMGTFKPASKEAIEKRVIRTAKRRNQNPSDGAKQGVFSGFGGFSKAQPSSFDFLANLTNGSKPVNGSTSSKTDTAVSSSGSNSLATSRPSGGLFTLPVSSSSSKALFNATSQSSSLFGGSVPTSSSSLFTASKADSTVGNFSFKPQSTKSIDTTKTDSTSVVSSTMFGIPHNNTEAKKSLFSTAPISSPFKVQTVSSPNTITPNSSITSKTENKSTEDKSEESDKKMRYYTKLKGLNESVSDWIKQHVEKTPLCILSPIFKDYEKHLKEIQAEYQGPDSNDATNKHSETTSIIVGSKAEPTAMKSSPFTGSSSLFSSSNLKTNTTSPFSTQSSPNSFGEKGINSVSSASSPPKTQGFSFGINSSPQSSTIMTNSTASTSFSFGVGKPFSISNFSAPKSTEEEKNKEADDEPPKVEYTPVVEKDSVYEKKCKIFVKKDGNFADRGVGTLYIKKIEESEKYQLLVRANTNLGNVILNLILATAIPTQRMGKNNVMMVCIPTPDAKPPPTSILIRVKTSEEADELLETLNKYKM
ncbi:nuclear pore complex protein Nup50 isoform X1 [Cydia pomonella]|uniref:nuclear pore complex protein Nup50 isoform X1 n=1 Tax=Cydia pomonella TaxID=82600 RepID=UPI002ADE44DA|nr:nuclear pore complex protein Nup50 isoform X1 [Cydia pomonella]XP_061705718.1 nuclear pore complex protein Nup50 isoform X1 [Cydia pomonella]